MTTLHLHGFNPQEAGVDNVPIKHSRAALRFGLQKWDGYNLHSTTSVFLILSPQMDGPSQREDLNNLRWLYA